MTLFLILYFCLVQPPSLGPSLLATASVSVSPRALPSIPFLTCTVSLWPRNFMVSIPTWMLTGPNLHLELGGTSPEPHICMPNSL